MSNDEIKINDQDKVHQGKHPSSLRSEIHLKFPSDTILVIS